MYQKIFKVNLANRFYIGDNLTRYFRSLGDMLIDKQNLKSGNSPDACIIWMHGLGSNAEDMQQLASQIPFGCAIKHVCLNAPFRNVTINQGMNMRAWYDIFSFELSGREDAVGIESSSKIVLETINTQLQAGFSPSQIFLSGFSQGGAMALWSAFHSNLQLGGVIALSAYLPLSAQCRFELPQETPIFIGYGSFDTIVKPQWSAYSSQLIRQNGFERLTVRLYPMDHSVCLDEMRDLANWFNTSMEKQTIRN